MIDFSKYTLQELQAISDALDTLTDDIVERDLSVGWVFREYRNAREAVEKKIAQHVREAEKKLEALQAEPAGAPAVKCCNIDRCGVCLTDCPYSDEPLPAGAAEPASVPAADPPAPDMFGWVGDALDDLCAAGEVIGNDR